MSAITSFCPITFKNEFGSSEGKNSYESLAPFPIFSTRAIASFESFHHVEAKALSYTANFKLKVIEKATEVGNREAARIFSIDELNIRLWRKNKTNFENCDQR
ncbi:brkDBD domain-containing protein [Trichonephila clavipes]|nr:brkDBD domain-containing protein [Trichonephila clavipes]